MSKVAWAPTCHNSRRDAAQRCCGLYREKASFPPNKSNLGEGAGRRPPCGQRGQAAALSWGRRSGGDEQGGAEGREGGRGRPPRAGPASARPQPQPQREWPEAQRAKLSMSHQQKMSLEKSVHRRPEGSATRGHVEFGGTGNILTLCWLSPEPPPPSFQRDAALCKAVTWHCGSPRTHRQGGAELGMNPGVWLSSLRSLPPSPVGSKERDKGLNCPERKWVVSEGGAFQRPVQAGWAVWAHQR